MTEKSSIEQWLDGKTSEELAAIEVGKKTYYADTIKRRSPKDAKKYIEEPIYLSVPTMTEHVMARLEAVRFIADMVDDPEIKTVDQAKARVAEALWEEVDMYHFMAYALYRREETPTQYMLAKFLMENVKRGPMYELLEKVQLYARTEDPRIGKLDWATFKGAVRAIARVSNLSPLVAIDADARDTFVVTMATVLASSPTFSSSSPSSEKSTPEP